MGKGRQGEGCGVRYQVGLEEAALPGRSARARHTFALLQQCGLSQGLLLRDLQAPDQQVSPQRAEAPTMAHNALMHWVGSSYPGHPRYDAEHEARRRELFFCLLLDGDRRAQHTYFYGDPRSGSEWTLAAGAAARGWYRLPHDGQGHLDGDRLTEAVQSAMRQEQTLVEALRQAPLDTLAACADLPQPPGTGGLEQLRLQHVHQLADQAELDQPQRRLLLQAARRLQGLGQSPRTEGASAEVRELLEQLQPQSSPEGLPVLRPRSRLARLLADAQQGTLAGGWCDVLLAEWARADGRPDDLPTLLAAKDLASRSPWHSPEGRKLFAAGARRQETRLRCLHALASGAPVPSAPVHQRQLRPQA